MHTIRNFSKKLTLPLFATFIVALFVSCSGSSELSGVYEGIDSRTSNTYKVTFMEGHTFEWAQPTGHAQGTYKVEGKTIQGDMGIMKLNFQIVDGQTLSTTWEDRPLLLKKRQ